MSHESYRCIVILHQQYRPESFRKKIKNSGIKVYSTWRVFPFLTVQLADFELKYLRSFEEVKDIRISTKDENT